MGSSVFVTSDLTEAAAHLGKVVLSRFERKTTGHFVLENQREYTCYHCKVLVPVGCLIYVCCHGGAGSGINGDSPLCSRGECREFWEWMFSEHSDTLLKCNPDAGCEALHLAEYVQ